MFGALRENQTIYMLDKGGESPALKVGQVVSVSQPQGGMAGVQYGQPWGAVSNVDIVARFGEERVRFERIPAALSIANYGGGGVVIAETREAMCEEVEAMARASRQAIESVDYQRKVLERCEAMLEDLSPQYAKERAQEDKIAELESRVAEIGGTMGEMMALLREMNAK